jgi:hypothetical protein
MNTRYEIVEKLGVVRQPGYLYYLTGTEVWRARMKRATDPDTEQPTKVATGSFIREQGYHYLLSPQGDIVRMPRTRSHRPPPKWTPSGDRAQWETEVVTKIVATQRAWIAIAQRGGEGVEAVAAEALRGCRRAVDALGENLRRIGYPAEWPVTRTPPGLDERLTRLGHTIHVPPILRLFWKEVGGISLVDLDGYDHTAFWSARGVDAEFCDGLYVYTCSDDYVTHYEVDDEDGLVLAPDGYHKDNISGGDPYCVIPGDRWTPGVTLSWTGFIAPRSAVEPLDFLGYLRTAILECAGFPGLLGDPAFEKLRPQLLADVPSF